MQLIRFIHRGCTAIGFFVAALVLVSLVSTGADACTSILVTRGASADGSVMITYSCDAPGVYAWLGVQPAADHKPGTMIDLGPQGKIPQVAHTYRTMGLMNEFQVAISESTFGGRPETLNPQGKLNYGLLMHLGLQRGRTAREALEVITKLVAEHGYGDVGESISIADPNEAWILEIVGSGPGGKGGCWVAVRIPDGHISCHANQSRIGEFPRNDPANCLYSEGVENLAIQKGWYDPKSGKPFRFFEAYSPATPIVRRACDTRVWSIYRRAAPSRHFSPDYHRNVSGSEPYPLSIKPDAKISMADMFALMRDHYEGTPYDMTKGVDAGPFGSPYRWRPMKWSLDGVQYAWERPLSTQQVGFSFITQSRGWLPNDLGGVTWYGVDDTWTTCYLPFYLGVESLPKCLSTGSLDKVTMDSAWWVFNVVSNLTYARYSSISPEVGAVQKDIESNLLALQPAVEKTALELSKSNPNLMVRYLTDYCAMHAEQTVTRWQALAHHIFLKYRDGYIRDDKGDYYEAGYPEEWLRRVIRERGEQLRLESPPKK